MKQIKQFLMYLSICFFLWGCLPWSKAFKEKEVIARFGLDDTGISSILDIDGYYLSNDTTLDGIAFYKDGTIKQIDVNHRFHWIPISDGVYTISNDTIYAETFCFIGMNGGMQLFHLRFKIFDKQHLQLFEWSDYDSSYKKNDVFRFIPSDSLPLPYTHMKQKKWMWTDKNKWKAYMNNNVRVKYWQ